MKKKGNKAKYKTNTKEKTENLIKNANVLIISSNPNDYDFFKKNFNNISYFKSIVRAEAYFKEHPDELSKYAIIVLGYNKLLSLPTEKETELLLPQRIKECSKKAIVVKISSHYHHLGGYNRIDAIMQSNSKTVLSNTEYDDIISTIIAKAIKENLMDNFKGLKIKRSTTKEKKSLGMISDNSELKILIVGPLFGKNQVEKENCRKQIEQIIKNKTGLNIEYKESSYTSFSEHIRDNLGNYDIIINDGSYLGNVAKMQEESQEQCQDTGRELTVLTNFFSKIVNDGKRRKTYYQSSICGISVNTKEREGTIANEIEYAKENDSLIEAIINILQISVNLYSQEVKDRKAQIEEERRQKEEERRQKEKEAKRLLQIKLLLTLNEALEKNTRETNTKKTNELIQTIEEILQIANNYLDNTIVINTDKVAIVKTEKGIQINNMLDGRNISNLLISDNEEEIIITIETSETRRGLTPSRELHINKKYNDTFPNQIQIDTINATHLRLKEYNKKTAEKAKKRKYPNELNPKS